MVQTIPPLFFWYQALPASNMNLDKKMLSKDAVIPQNRRFE